MEDDERTHPAEATTKRPSLPRSGLEVIGYGLSLVAQAIMIVVGVVYSVQLDPMTAIEHLAIWCAIGTVYALFTIVVLALQARPVNDPTEHQPSQLVLSAPARIITFCATILSSVIGMGAAFQVLLLRSDASLGLTASICGVWAMLLSWGFLHWGFTQLYYQGYYSTDDPPLHFPEKDRPRMVDFAYFAYTLGTSFAVSDVETRRTSMRWRLLTHSVLSFFFNGLIIVLALNTIQNV